jgi:hypothetical protein
MKKHFVTFHSPGTFLPESTTKEIDSWNVQDAAEMAHDIVERHGATPFCFSFSTRERNSDDWDHKETETSGRYYLGGEIQTLEQIKAKNDPQDSILISNMENNNISKVVVNSNSYKSTHELRDGDTVLEWTPRKKS